MELLIWLLCPRSGCLVENLREVTFLESWLLKFLRLRSKTSDKSSLSCFILKLRLSLCSSSCSRLVLRFVFGDLGFRSLLLCWVCFFVFECVLWLCNDFLFNIWRYLNCLSFIVKNG